MSRPSIVQSAPLSSLISPHSFLYSSYSHSGLAAFFLPLGSPLSPLPGTLFPFPHLTFPFFTICLFNTYSNFRYWIDCSVAKSCLTLCDPMDCSMPGFPVLYCLLESVQTHHNSADQRAGAGMPFPFLYSPQPLPFLFPSLCCNEAYSFTIREGALKNDSKGHVSCSYQWRQKKSSEAFLFT